MIFDIFNSNQEFRQCLELISNEEKERIARQCQEIDRKRSLIGRLLLRVAILIHCKDKDVLWKDIIVGRSTYGKPILVSFNFFFFSFLSPSPFY